MAGVPPPSHPVGAGPLLDDVLGQAIRARGVHHFNKLKNGEKFTFAIVDKSQLVFGLEETKEGSLGYINRVVFEEMPDLVLRRADVYTLKIYELGESVAYFMSSSPKLLQIVQSIGEKAE